jgi:threonine synthase
VLVPGDFDVCNTILKDLVSREKIFPANSINPTRIEGHQATVFRIGQHLNWQLPDWIAVPVGNGSNCSSVGKGLRTLREFGLLGYRDEGCHILGVQTESADPMASSFPNFRESSLSFEKKMEMWEKAYRPMNTKDTMASAMRIGDPTSRKKVMREIIHSNGSMEEVREKRIAHIISLVGKDGLSICPQTAVMIEGVKQATENRTIDCGETVVGVSTASVLKFTDTVSKSLLKEAIEVEEATTDAVMRALKL